jgi:hypothetical protein
MSAPQHEGMFDLERDRPGLMAVLYAAAIVGAMLASHFWPWGVGT